MEFEINNKAEVFSDDDERIGSSLIQGFDKEHIYISVPIEKGIKKALKTGTKLRLIYYDETHLYMFESLVEGMRRDNIILYELIQPKKIEVIQRREDFRLSIVLEMKYLKVSPAEIMDINELDMDKIEDRFKDRLNGCLSIDLSGQGIGLMIDEMLSIGEQLLVISNSPSFDVVLVGHVVHRYKQFRKKGFNYKVGIRFVDQSFKTKEKIVGFIFKKMREQLKTRA